MDGTATCRWLFLVAVMLASMAISDVTADYHRVQSKRDLTELGSMIGSVLGKSLMSVYTSYNGYGCYCGIGGSGRAVDGVDRCCQAHDRCFGRAQRGVCAGSDASIYSQWYKYTTKASKAGGAKATIQCGRLSSYSDMRQGQCATAVCQCDSALATCFAGQKYNSKYSSYDRTKCK